MRVSRLTERETFDLTNYQLSSLGRGVERGVYRIEDVGDILPGAVMVQDLAAVKLTYMNKWGCDTLNQSAEELEEMGEDYYRKFFFEEEIKVHMAGMMGYVTKQDPSSLYHFYQRVKTGRKMDPALYYTTGKLLAPECPRTQSSKLIVIANPVPGMGLTMNKLSKFLQENEYAARNYSKFVQLTPREKEIISLLVEGKSSAEISDILFLSCHTVTTHRKNIARKLNINSFAELVKFANAFDLIVY